MVEVTQQWLNTPELESVKMVTRMNIIQKNSKLLGDKESKNAKNGFEVKWLDFKSLLERNIRNQATVLQKLYADIWTIFRQSTGIVAVYIWADFYIQ